MANRYPLIVTNTTAGDSAPFSFKELPVGDDFRLDGTGASSNNPIRAGGTTTELPIIKDANGNTVISLPTPTASANNYFVFSTSASASAGVLGRNVIEVKGSTATDVTLHLKPKGGGTVEIGTGAATGIFQSNGSNDLTIRTGNSTTGSITIANGANANISISPNGTGRVALGTLTSAGLGIAGSTSGTITVQATATAGTNTITLPAVTGTVVTTADSGSVTSTMIADGTILNADINTSAAIAYSKLSLNNSITNSDLAGSIALTKLASDTTTALGVGTLDLGHASDTTLARSASGQVSIEGIQILTQTNTVTGITNKTFSGFTMTDGNDIVIGTGTGTKIGTAATQKIGFFGTTPATRVTVNAALASNSNTTAIVTQINSIRSALVTLGLAA